MRGGHGNAPVLTAFSSLLHLASWLAMYGSGDLLEANFLHEPKICKNQWIDPKQKANQLARTLPGTPRHVVLASRRFCECCEQKFDFATMICWEPFFSLPNSRTFPSSEFREKVREISELGNLVD